MEQLIKKGIPIDYLSSCLIAYETTSDLMIQLEMVFADQIEADRLSQAVRLSLISEPLLGCRLVSHWRKPYWIQTEISLEDIFMSAGSQSDYDAFKQRHLSPYSGPQMQVCLLNSLEGAQLLIKVTHQLVDAAGVKDIARVLSCNYEALGLDKQYRPQAKPITKQSQDAQKIVDLVPKKDRGKLKKIYGEYAKLGRSPSKTFKLPIQQGCVDTLTFIQRVFDPDKVEQLKQYGRKHDATLNDLLVASFFRAQARVGEWNGRRELAMNMTVDLRKHLPENQATTLTNLSIPLKYWPCLSKELGQNFLDTLEKVTAATRQRKAFFLGLDFLMYIWPVFRRMPQILCTKAIRAETQQERKSDNWADTFTNMGPIDPAWVTFGSKPIKAHLLPPAKFPPYFLLGASGYNGSLTLSASCYTAQKELSSKFLDAMVSELEDVGCV